MFFWAVVESFPVQNQAASQKLLQKISTSNQDNRHSRGRRYRGKGKEEEPAVFTLEEWEKRKAGAKPFVNHKLPDTSNDEDLAWQLQNQLDLEDSHVNILLSLTVVVIVFSFQCLILMFSSLFRSRAECMTHRQRISE